MNPTKKLSMAVPVMRDSLMCWCGHLNAIHHVATNEHEPSDALNDVIEHVKYMHNKVRDMCNAYDRLRHLVAELETEQGVTSPRFYADSCAGKVCKGHCPNLI